MSALVEALLRPEAWPHPVETPRLIETHISWVILTGPSAYKIKKPVALGFLDFSTLALRRHFCEEELRINRRFTPELYLEVVPITADDQGFRIGGEGEVVEWALRMRQFPPGAVLSELILHENVPDRLWRELGRDLARLQRELPAARDADETQSPGTPASVRDAVMQNFRQCRPYLRDSEEIARLNLIEERAWGDYRRLEQAMWRRLENGFVRECHGDLHLGNLVLLEGRVVPFDAVEFNAAFRWIDVISEMAFLVMDCESRGVGGAGWSCLNAWLEHSGDYASLGLLAFYLSYRAMVRAKVSLLIGRPPVEEDSESHRNYRRYSSLALSLGSPGQGPVLLIMCGVSGSGKSTLAELLAARLRAIRIRSDVERKRLFGLAPEQSSRDASSQLDIYTAEAGERTFARLEDLAARIIDDGYPVIVDATFIDSALRQRFAALAVRKAVPFRIIFCDVPVAELRRRVSERERRGGDASEAGLEVLESQLRHAEFPDPCSEPVSVVNASDQSAADALAAEITGARGAAPP